MISRWLETNGGIAAGAQTVKYRFRFLEVSNPSSRCVPVPPRGRNLNCSVFWQTRAAREPQATSLTHVEGASRLPYLQVEALSDSSFLDPSTS